MVDLLVRLYDLPKFNGAARLAEQGVAVRRAIPPERHVVVDFAARFFPGWGSECGFAFSGLPVPVWIATHDGDIIGFACAEATAKGFFGPTGVAEDWQGKGVGAALLFAALTGMREAGYGYAVIGGVGDALEFYKKHLDVIEIPGSEPGVYKDMLRAPDDPA